MPEGNVDDVVKIVNELTAGGANRLSFAEQKAELVRRSRPKDSPTHKLFQWDDGKAAALYRLDQAGKIIMSVRVVFEERPNLAPVRAFPSVVVDGKRGPVPMRRVLASRDLIAAALEEAKAAAAAWAARYKHLRDLAELAPVFAAIEAASGRKRLRRSG